MTLDAPDLEIDPEFHGLCPPLTTEELAQLEANLLADGCRDPLVVWLKPEEEGYCKPCDAERPLSYHESRWTCDACGFGVAPETFLLVDGHNRYTICKQHGLDYKAHQIDLDSREEVVNWIIDNQLGRRNLESEQRSYLRGKRYNLEKKREGRPGKPAHFEQVNGDTKARLAEEYHVSPVTISRDATFAAAVDTLDEQVRDDIRQAVLQRNGSEKITKKQVTQAAELIQEQTVEPLPFMRHAHWKPYQVLQAIDLLSTIPQDEHAAINTLLDQPHFPAEEGLKVLGHLQQYTAPQRHRLYALQASTDPREHSLATTLAAQKVPEPDPQIFIAEKLITLLDEARRHLRRWTRLYPDEPWSGTVQTAEPMLADMQADWRTITDQARTLHQERIASYAEAFTSA